MEKKTSIWVELGRTLLPEHSQTLVGFGHPDCKGRGSGGTGAPGPALAAFWVTLLLLWVPPTASVSHSVPTTSLPLQHQLGGVNALKNPLLEVE